MIRHFPKNIIVNIFYPIKNLKWFLYQRSRTKNDFILATMHASGTRWLKLMIAKATVENYQLGYKFQNIQPIEIIPTFRSPTQRFIYNNLQYIPRIQHTHMSYIFPYSWLIKKQKVILLVRNIRDSMVSEYSKADKTSLTFSKFLREQRNKNRAEITTLKGKIKFFNTWGDFVKNNDKAIILRYEDLKKSPEKELARVLNFLGLENANKKLISKVVNFCSMEKMRKLDKQARKDKTWARNINPPEKAAVNKGKTNYKSSYTEKDMRYLKAALEKFLKHHFGY